MSLIKVHLSHNRYGHNGIKVTAPVEFPLEELDMREYTKLEQLTTEQCVYDLIACVCHQGSKYLTNIRRRKLLGSSIENH